MICVASTYSQTGHIVSCFSNVYVDTLDIIVSTHLVKSCTRNIQQLHLSDFLLKKCLGGFLVSVFGVSLGVHINRCSCILSINKIPNPSCDAVEPWRPWPFSHHRHTSLQTSPSSISSKWAPLFSASASLRASQDKHG